MKLLTVIGARPQFIKSSMISKEIAATHGVEEILVHTGQHFDKNMSEVFFSELGIPNPDYNLGIGGGSHGEMTGKQLIGLEKVLLKERPDCVLVYGDTNSTLAGALAATKLHIPIAHIEAGLRSFNRKMPEETNRVLTDHMSDYLFTPTRTACSNLINEGIAASKVRLVGDIMYDAALHFMELSEVKSSVVSKLKLDNQEYILATIHRAENTDSPERLRNIFRAFSRSKHQIIMPVHPRTGSKLKEHHILLPKNVTLIDPVGYLDMIQLEKNASYIFTDSGGIQKEAYFYNVPCITFRAETEWTELLDSGVNVLYDPSSDQCLTDTMAQHKPISEWVSGIYGTGNTAKQIITELML